MQVLLSALNSFFSTKIGGYVLAILLVLLVFGGWKGFTCISQSINREEPDEVQDANIPADHEYDQLKLPK